MKILVLDDHAAFRDEVVQILVRNGHEAQGAETADQALPLVKNGAYDFVLVDYQMPQHDGIWFMQNAELPSHTKAILVTAHVNRRVIETMFKVGASGYLIKPFEEADLLANLAFYGKEESSQ